MKIKGVKIGMRVVPHRKTTGLTKKLNNSVVWKKAQEMNQPFLYVTGKEGNEFLLKEIYVRGCGDYFLASDFEPYVEFDHYVEKKEKSRTEKQNLELIFNGTTTIALLKGKDGKYYKGVAKLHHEDIYDKLTGIRIAVGRALGLDVELPQEKTLEDFDNEEFLEEMKKRMVKEEKYLTYDEIRKLPHGTEIEYTDNYSGRNISKKGYINQEKKWISSPYKIDWNSWNFTSLEKREIQAKILKYAI